MVVLQGCAFVVLVWRMLLYTSTQICRRDGMRCTESVTCGGTRLEDLVYNLPKLKQEQHKGYMHVEDKRRDLQDVSFLSFFFFLYQRCVVDRCFFFSSPTVDGQPVLGVQRTMHAERF